VRDRSASAADARQIAVSPSALEWIADTAHRLRRGFILVIDDDRHTAPLSKDSCPIRCEGTSDRDEPATMQWLDAPAERRLAAGVDFAGVQRAAGQEGCVTVRFADQASFLVGVAGHLASDFTEEERRAFAALTRAGGAGSSRRVLLLVKNVDAASDPSS
jgi:SAM-dependent MidA family methyltransferase